MLLVHEKRLEKNNTPMLIIFFHQQIWHNIYLRASIMKFLLIETTIIKIIMIINTTVEVETIMKVGDYFNANILVNLDILSIASFYLVKIFNHHQLLEIKTIRIHLNKTNLPNLINLHQHLQQHLRPLLSLYVILNLELHIMQLQIHQTQHQNQNILVLKSFVQIIVQDSLYIMLS